MNKRGMCEPLVLVGVCLTPFLRACQSLHRRQAERNESADPVGAHILLRVHFVCALLFT